MNMKIGITCYPTYGGSGVVATELGMELAARGHEIHFISYAPPDSADGYESSAFSFMRWKFPVTHCLTTRPMRFPSR